MTVVDYAPPGAALEHGRTPGRTFDVAILDMHMPDMDGVGLARASARPPAGPGAAVPADLARRRRTEADELGLVHLTKPVKADALRHTRRPRLGARPRAAPARRPGAIRPLRILLAEDNAVNQRVGVLMLERMGQRPVVVGNGSGGRGRWGRDVDLVLMDVQMPGWTAGGDPADPGRVPRERQPRIVAMTASALRRGP